jgi:hypothetical protein
MSWSILIGPEDGVLAEYTSLGDLSFIDALYDYGAALIILTDLDGNPTPVEEDVVRIIWDYGLASEEVHWEGYLSTVQNKQQGNTYVLRGFTYDGKLNIRQTGSTRDYLNKTPYQIIQAAGSPSPLLVGDSGAAVLAYGSDAAVPNKVDGSNPGTALAQFSTDVKMLFTNMKRLSLQGVYGDGSVGLEWLGRLEGVNSSSPRFYMVKRRERAASYTPEVFNIPDDIVNARRGSDLAPGFDYVKVFGAGVGSTRIVSTVAAFGTVREFVSEDQTIFKVQNANNMAQRLLDIYPINTEIVIGSCYRHTSPTRAGDTVRITQDGYSDTFLRVIMRTYSLAERAFIYTIGRPNPQGRDWILQLGSNVSAAASTGGGGGTPATRLPLNVVTVTTNYNATTSNDVILVDATAAPVTVNLPDATLCNGKQLSVKKIDSSLNQVTLDPNGVQTIDGDATLIIKYQRTAVDPISDGSNWRVF